MHLSHSQLLLCEQQARLFESLDRRNVDAKPFIRAYMNSKAVEGLDADYDRMQWAGEQYIFEEVMDEAGLKTDTDCERYNTEALFYAGWIYRFWHYMTGESSKEIFRQADENDILGSYGLHIEANELAVEDLKAAAKGRGTGCSAAACGTCVRKEPVAQG